MGDEAISNGFRTKLEQDLNEFQSLMSITLEAYHLCLQHYSDRMQASLSEIEFFNPLEFTKLHQSMKNEAITQFRSKPGDYGLKFKIEPIIEQNIDGKLSVYEKQNEERRQHFEKRTKLNIEQANNEIFEKVRNTILEEINQPDSSLTYSHLSTVLNNSKQAAVEQLNSTQNSGDEMLNRFRDMLSLTFEAYHLCLQLYNDKMQNSLNGVEYYSTFDLTKLHQSVKNEAIAQFRSTPGDFGLKFNMQWRVEKNVDDKFIMFEKQNEEKLRNFMEKASWHSETVKREIQSIEAATQAPPASVQVVPETAPPAPVPVVPEAAPAAAA